MELDKRPTQWLFVFLLCVAVGINLYFLSDAPSYGGWRMASQSQPTNLTKPSATPAAKPAPTPVVSSFQSEAISQPRPQVQPQPTFQRPWPYGATPTRKYKVPDEFNFKPTSDGSYHWSETIRSGDDLQIDFANNWAFEWNTEEGLEIMLKTPEGDWVSHAQAVTSVAFRARLKPATRNNAQLDFVLSPTSQDQRKNPSTPSLNISKDFGDFRIELQSLRIANGRDYLLAFSVTNLNPSKTISVALIGNPGTIATPLFSAVSDPDGFEFTADASTVRGLAVGGWWQLTGYDGNVTQIKPHDSISATINFFTRPGRNASRGTCRIQLTIGLLNIDGYGKVIGFKSNNFMTECNAR